MALPFSFVAPTVYGQMILSRYDINQTGALLRTGAAEGHGDIELMRSILATIEAPHVFVDVGANVGAYSLGLTSAIGSQGKIYAFEPQRIIFNMLAGTMALNGVTNVFRHNIALGEREDLIEIPQFDYDKSLNFGSIEFGPQQKEALSQTRGKNPEKIEYVRLATLDSFEFTNVNLLKIDAEGMEMQILEGANQTISNCRPVMYIEFFKSDRTALQQKIISHDYDVHVNGVNFLCIPRERSADIRVRS